VPRSGFLACSCFFEQIVGDGAVAGRSIDFGFTADNFVFQSINPRRQFGKRQWIKVLPQQLRKRIILSQRKIIINIHPASVDWTALAVNKQRQCIGRFLGNIMANLPSTMTAIEISEPGGPEVLVPCIRPVPHPSSGEVLIRVVAAGVNRPDVIQRMGLYPPPPGASDIPGLEIAGEVVAVGDGVSPEILGQNMCALVTGGGYAQYCVAVADLCLPVPSLLSMAQAAALPETLFTVWHNVFERAYAVEGETVLIHGGTSGIGTMAIKLGKLFGLTIIVTCGSDAKCAAALKLGADHAINYKTADFVEEVAVITQGQGVHIVLDMVAGSYVPRNLKSLREDGRHVTIAVQGGMVAEINMAVVMSRRLTLTGSTLRPRTVAFKALLADEIYRNVWPMVANGELLPEMDTSFALKDASAAHARMEAGDHVGKIVLEI
jgi:NADPH:quinone reductase